MLAHLSIKIVCQITPPPQAWERLVEAPAGLPSYFRDLSVRSGLVRNPCTPEAEQSRLKSLIDGTSGRG